MHFHVCRACLRPEKDVKLASIFSENGKYSHLIEELTNLKIANVRESPALLCSSCIKDLETATKIRNSILKNHEKFTESKLRNLLCGISGSSSHDISTVSNKSLLQNDGKLARETDFSSQTSLLPESFSNDSKMTEFHEARVKSEPIDKEIDDYEIYVPENAVNTEYPLLLTALSSKRPIYENLQAFTIFSCENCGKFGDEKCQKCTKESTPKIKENVKTLDLNAVTMITLANLASLPKLSPGRITKKYHKRNERRC